MGFLNREKTRSTSGCELQEHRENVINCQHNHAIFSAQAETSSFAFSKWAESWLIQICATQISEFPLCLTPLPWILRKEARNWSGLVVQSQFISVTGYQLLFFDRRNWLNGCCCELDFQLQKHEQKRTTCSSCVTGDSTTDSDNCKPWLMHLYLACKNVPNCHVTVMKLC